MLLKPLSRSVLVLGSQLLPQSWAIPVDPNACLDSSDVFSTCQKPFKFAVLGDSWASGVSYNSASEYDANAAGCMRTTDAYGVQMKNDVSWAGANIYFDFPACSGSHMRNIVKENCQICQLQDPDLLIMTIGGNDMKFFPVVDACVYHSNNDIDYGPAYNEDPGRIGECAKAIDAATAYIESDLGGFKGDLRTTYQDMLNSDQAKSNPKLRIYQTGYVHFFSEADGSDWCNGWSFWPGKHIPLSHYLRSDMNTLVTKANSAIQEVTSAFSEQHVGYVSTTEAFNGHRFCEAGSNFVDQYLSDDVWLWNVVPQVFINPSWALEPEQQLPYPWIEDPLWDFSKPGNSSLGFERRPFHPKVFGFEAIKDAIIKQLKADKVPGVNA